MVEDEDMKSELAGLCRFFSRNGGNDFVSFDEYIAKMKVRDSSLVALCTYRLFVKPSRLCQSVEY